MKLYIASHSQEEARKIASICSQAGHEITSRWLQEDFSKTSQYTDDDKCLIADNDYDDVTKADALVLLFTPYRVPGGKFVEAGIALGQLKMVYVIGARENMLLWHTRVKQFVSIEDFLKSVSVKTPPQG